MKFIPIILLVTSLIVSFIFWIATPLIFSIIVSILNLKGVFFSNVIPITGAVVGILALIPYYEAYSYTGTDGQAGLIFAVMPVYQFIAIGIVGVISFIARRLRKDNPSDSA